MSVALVPVNLIASAGNQWPGQKRSLPLTGTLS